MGDLNKDGRAELFIFDRNNIGVLRWDESQGTFSSHQKLAKHSLINTSWSVVDQFGPSTRFTRGIFDLDGDKRNELVLERVNSRLKR